ncbi:hypothetical protein RI054_06g35240 [Pseudoscourfieldia marina]
MIASELPVEAIIAKSVPPSGTVQVAASRLQGIQKAMVHVGTSFRNSDKVRFDRWQKRNTSLEFDGDKHGEAARQEALTAFIRQQRNIFSTLDHLQASNKQTTLREARRAARSYEKEFGPVRSQTDVDDGASDTRLEAFYQTARDKQSRYASVEAEYSKQTRSRHHKMSADVARVIIARHMRRYIAKRRWIRARNKAMALVSFKVAGGYSHSKFSPSVLLPDESAASRIIATSTTAKNDGESASALAADGGDGSPADAERKRAVSPKRDESYRRVDLSSLGAPRLSVVRDGGDSPTFHRSPLRRRRAAPPPWAASSGATNRVSQPHLTLLRSLEMQTGSLTMSLPTGAMSKATKSHKPWKQTLDRAPLEEALPPPVLAKHYDEQFGSGQPSGGLGHVLSEEISEVLLVRTNMRSEQARRRQDMLDARRKEMRRYETKLAIVTDALSQSRVYRVPSVVPPPHPPRDNTGEEMATRSEPVPTTPRLVASLPMGSPRARPGSPSVSKRMRRKPASSPSREGSGTKQLFVASSPPPKQFLPYSHTLALSSLRTTTREDRLAPTSLRTETETETEAAMAAAMASLGHSRPTTAMTTSSSRPATRGTVVRYRDQPHTSAGVDYDGSIRSHPVVVPTMRVYAVEQTKKKLKQEVENKEEEEEEKEEEEGGGEEEEDGKTTAAGTTWRKPKPPKGERRTCNKNWGAWLSDPLVAPGADLPELPEAPSSPNVERPTTAPARNQTCAFSFTRAPYLSASRGRLGAEPSEVREDAGGGWLSKVAVEPKFGYTKVPRAFPAASNSRQKTRVETARRRINQRAPRAVVTARRDRLTSDAKYSSANEDVFVFVGGRDALVGKKQTGFV